MKNPLDPRHQKREELLQSVFSWDFTKKDQARNKDLVKLLEKLSEIDEKIIQAAPAWPLDKIAKVDLAILRLAVNELTIVKKEPPKVVIDEAIELGKKYGSDSSASFINGVLGTIYSNEKK
mgnify:CR=1 FL=1